MWPSIVAIAAAAAAIVATQAYRRERGRAADVARRLDASARDCAEARNERDALAAQARSRTTLPSIADAVITTDAQGRVSSMNATAEAWTGWSMTQAHGRALDEIVVVAPGETPGATATLVSRGGSRRHVQRQSAPIVDRDARELGRIETFRDATPQHAPAANEQRLREAAQSAERSARLVRAELDVAHGKFAAFMANFPYPAFIQDERGEFVFFNAAGAASTSWRGAARHAGADGLAETVSDAGDDQHHLFIRFPLALEGHAWLGGIAIDFTERVRTGRALAERTAEFETLFDNVPAPLWIARDARGNDVVGNAAANALAAASPPPAWQFLRDGVPLEPDATPIRIAMRERRIVHGTDVEVVRADGGRRHLRITAAPLFDAKGRVRGAVAAGLDISQLKSYEAELEREVRRRDEFLAVLAHELRNPLAPIRNSVQLLQRVPHDVERVRRATATIDRQTLLIVRLIDDLLDVARVSQGLVELDLAPRTIQAIVDGALEAVAAETEKTGHVLEVEHVTASAVVLVDALRAEQIVVNVLTNALKYSPPRTRVRIRSWVEGDHARIAVSDEGQGIPAEHLAEIFTMFARPGVEAKRRVGGMGVGLALAKQLCEQQGGSIEARSEGRGRGATFTISFPLALAAADRAA